MSKYFTIPAVVLGLSLILCGCSGDGDESGGGWGSKPDSKREKGKFKCPRPNVIGYYQSQVGGFKDQRLDWSIDNIGMRVSNNMRFAQAVYNHPTNQFTCNYEWPNPDKEGTWIVITVNLIPNAALEIVPLSEKWKKEGTSSICVSQNPDDCKFNRRRKKFD